MHLRHPRCRPYVYNAFARDIAGLESAIVAALAHPIDS